MLTSDEEMERNLGEWRRMIVLYECDGMNVQYNMYVQYYKYQNIMPPNLSTIVKQKETRVQLMDQ